MKITKIKILDILIAQKRILKVKKNYLKKKFNFLIALITETYNSSRFLNHLNASEIDEYCLIFIKNIFLEDSSPEKIINLIHKAFENNSKKEHLNPEKKQNMAKNIFESLLKIYEFADRGMKGFLSGDISYQMIKATKETIEKYIIEIEDLEKNFVEMGLDPNDFYDSFYKIDKNFFSNNTTKNLSFNYEIEGKDALFPHNNYVVNLKTTQFFDTVQKQIQIKEKKYVKFEDIKNIIDREKHKFQNIFNDMYNSIFQLTVTNNLKTPLYGIKFPQKENKQNLFRRQLILEDHAYDSSLRKFKENFIKLTE